MRQILRFQASQHNRHVFETWEVIQMGILGALLATSFLTDHRSRIVLICTGIMLLLVVIAYTQLTPYMNALSRSYDFYRPERPSANVRITTTTRSGIASLTS